MPPINNLYALIRHLRKKQRFAGPAILRVRGAEVVLEKPEPGWTPVPQPVEEQPAEEPSV